LHSSVRSPLERGVAAWKPATDAGSHAKHPAVRSTIAPSIGKAGKARLGRVAQQTSRVCEVNEPPPQRGVAAWKPATDAGSHAKHPAVRSTVAPSIGKADGASPSARRCRLKIRHRHW